MRTLGVAAQFHRVRLAATHERVLHDHAAGADLDMAVLAGYDRAKEDAGVRADPHVAAEHCGGRDVGAFIDGRPLAPMLDKHGLVV